MKKSLVIISFAFIFLLSVSIVSANFFDWITGGATKLTGSDNLPTRIAAGDTADLSEGYSISVDSVESETAEATVTNIQTGITEQISLQEGENVLNNGAVFNVPSIREGSLFRKGNIIITITPALNRETSEFAEITPSEACDNLVEEINVLIQEFNNVGVSSSDRITCEDAGCKPKCRLDLQGDAEIPCAYV